MFILNTFFFLYLSLHQKHERKFLVCENLLGNEGESDSDETRTVEKVCVAICERLSLSFTGLVVH